MAEYFGAAVGREHSRERKDPTSSKDKLLVEELQTRTAQRWKGRAWWKGGVWWQAQYW